ncbi:hypothetical protein ACQW02_02225 [Humitalea sp. 24SJ18S-53]|uniref:hypothetical protein n=1 Tax=Humitalea sp. 24SJ18S-53 TaxID=3422307 RepID=UPI003D67DF79
MTASLARRGLLGGALLIPAAALVATRAAAQRPRGLWFDPTQLPSYSGRLERWLTNPAGETDRGLFREGAQFVFPPADAEDLMAAVQPGAGLTVWGIRARTAPVITMLAWAKSDADPANFVASPAWFASTARGTRVLRIEGQVAGPLLSPQGDAMGVFLANGDSLRLAPAVHALLGNRLAVGQALAAEGPGTRLRDTTAIDATRIGANPEALEPVPVPEATPTEAPR